MTPWPSRIVTVATAILLSQTTLWASPAQDAKERTWSNSSGQFAIKATLLQSNDTHVQLGTTDGRKIAVRIDQLSEGDRAYLKGLQSVTGPDSEPAVSAKPVPPVVVATPAGPELLKKDASVATAAEGATLPTTEVAMELSDAGPPQGLAVDPAADTKPLAYGSLKLAPCDAYDKVSQPYVVDGTAGLVTLSIGRHKIKESEKARGRVFLGRLPDGKVEVVLDVPEGAQLLDYEPTSGRALVISGFDHSMRGGDLVLFDGLAEGKMVSVYRRQLPGMDKPGAKPQVKWARLLSGEHAACVVDGDLFVWNLRTAKLFYRIEKMGSSQFPALSPNRRYMAVPRSGGAVVLDVVDGAPKGFVGLGKTLTPGVAFDSAGRRIGLTADNQFLLWDCVDGRPTCETTLPTHLGGELLGWVAPDSLLTGLGRLIRTDLEMTAWTYSIAGSANATALPGGVLLAKKMQSCEILSLPIPHEAAKKAGRELQRGGDALMLVRPGVKVALDAEVTGNIGRAEVISALREAVEKTGWQVVDRAEIAVVAQIGQGEKKELSYQMRGMGTSRDSAKTVTATITPFTAEIQIRRGGQVLWTRKTENRVPPFLFLKGDQTLQDAVKEFERPDTSFFTRLTIPPRIPKSEIADGLGFSSLNGAEWRDISAADLARAKARRGR